MEEFRHIPVEDLILVHELRIAKEKGFDAFKCPCSDYKGGTRKNLSMIKHHLCNVARDPFLYHSMVGDDPDHGFPAPGIWIPITNPMSRTEGTSSHTEAPTAFPDAAAASFLDLEHDIRQQVFDTLNTADELLEEGEMDSGGAAESRILVVVCQGGNLAPEQCQQKSSVTFPLFLGLSECTNHRQLLSC
jgi:hypothetical protein